MTPNLKEPIKTGSPTQNRQKIEEPVSAKGQPPSRSPGTNGSKTTTIEIPVSVKAALDSRKVDPKEAVARTIERLVEADDASKSPEDMVIISMTPAKYQWLLRKQTNLDCIHIIKGHSNV